MAPPPSKAPGNGAADQGPSGKELQEVKQKAAMQAMMDDLGIARVEALPLADAPRDRAHVGGAGANERRRPPPPTHLIAEMRGGEMQDAARNAAAQRGWTVNELWKDAIDAGVFNDDEARGVEKLNDLGGGRIYDTAQNLSVRVKDLSVKILDHRTKRSFNPSHDQASANKRVCFDEKPKKKKNRKNSQAGAASQPQHHANLSRSSKNSGKPPNPNPLSRPNRVPPSPAPPFRLPESHVAVDLNAPLPFELPHVVFKTSAEFLSRDINPAAPAIILLSAAGRPELGFFTVVLLGRKFCQWPISTWYDYSSGADLGLQISFKDGRGAIQGYQLFFGNQDGLMEFMATVRSLQAGDYMDRVNHGLVPASSPAPAEATAAVPSNGAGGTHTEPPPTRPAANATTTPTVALTTTHRLATTANGLNGEGSPSPIQADNSNQAALIDFEANHVSSVASQHPSESTELLSTLEPYSLDTDDGPSSIGLSKEAVLLMVRSLFQFFLCSQAGGTASTVEEFGAIAQAVKAGVLQHIMDGARAEGLSGPKIEAFKDTINGVLAGVIRDQRATGQDVIVNFVAEDEKAGATAGHDGRLIRYTVEELLSMRHAAVEPPSRMINIPHLPRPAQRAGQSGASAPSRTSTEDKTGHFQTPAKRRPSIQFYRVRKSMDWVMGENSDPALVTAPEKTDNAESEKADSKAGSEKSPDAESKKSSKTESEETSGPVDAPAAASDTASAAQRRAVTDMGLGNSCWATGVSEVKHAHSFTGPQYERLSSKSSYWKDLLQLDTKTDLNPVGNEDLVDIFFPTTSNSNVERRVASASASASAGPRDASNHNIQMPNPASATTPRTDKIENLRIGISRLTIQSPRTSHPRYGSGLAEPSSPHSTQFHTPGGPVQPPPTEPVNSCVRLPLNEPTNPPVTEPATPSIQSPSTTQSPSTNTPAPATQPGFSGLGASRHSSGNAPASSGKFDFYLPGAEGK